MRRRPTLLVLALAFVVWPPLGASPAPADDAPAVAFGGELKQWHGVTLTLDGPHAHERDDDPNPFTDYRFDVTFAHESGSPTYVVPGYFAADGRAAETSADSGDKWRAHLSPDRTGTWTYAISFRAGEDAAIGGEGDPLEPFDGLAGTFEVAPSDKTGRDLRALGRLTYVGEHHLRFAGSGGYFLKVGADAPETLLAYVDYDGTEARLPRKAPLKTWGPHVRDWRPGDPTWQGGKGKGLIGAINYLSGKGMNAFSFLLYNAGGDGDNVWPFVGRDDRFHYDCSKLDQWGIVFEHGTRMGMYLHFKLCERENSGMLTPDSLAMDAGELGPERRLYLRELIARYSHNLALNWNLAEENSQTVRQQRDTARYIREVDPYDHPIVTHTTGTRTAQARIYTPLLGDRSALTGASIQTRDVMDTHRSVLHWVRESARAGRPWVVANDEQDLGAFGTPPDPGFVGYEQQEGPTIHDIRKYALWATLMAGGAGIEYYFGYKHPENDIRCEDWRSRDRTWDYARHAHEFFMNQHVPFWEMWNANALVGNPDDDNTRYCLAAPGSLYLIYLPDGGPAEIDLSGEDGDFRVEWFDPRASGAPTGGPVGRVRGGGTVSLGLPPSDPSEDWLVLLRADTPAAD